MWRQVECAPPGNIEQQLKAVHRKAASSYDKPKAEPHRRKAAAMINLRQSHTGGSHSRKAAVRFTTTGSVFKDLLLFWEVAFRTST